MAVQPSDKQQLSLGTLQNTNTTAFDFFHDYLDPTSEAGFIKYFDSLPEKPSTTIRFFDRNDYYTVHGQDAVLAAKEVFNSFTALKYLGGARKLEGVVLNKSNFATFVRNLLVVKQYRVEIFKSSGKSVGDWSLEYKATPGNFQQLEDVVFGDHMTYDCSAVLAIKLAMDSGQRVVGVAFIESTGRRLGVCQFVDNDQFSNVESLIVQVAPKECILCGTDTTTESMKLRRVIQRSNCCITERKKSEFDNKDTVQDLNRLLKTTSSGSQRPEFDLQYSMCAMAALIKYLNLLSDQSNFSSFSLESLDLHQYMRLDSAALKALNIEPTIGEDRTVCIIGILNKCQTHQGERLLTQWIKQPLIDSERIEERLDTVEAFLDDTSLRHTIREDHLKCFPDLYRVMKKLQRGKGALVDCVKVYQSLQRLPLLITALNGYNGKHKTVLDELFTKQLQELDDDFIKFQEMVETTIDLDNVHHNEYLIKPSFNDNLTRLRYDIDEIEEKINIIFRKTSSELSLEAGKNLKLDQNNQHGYYFRVTKKFEKSLRGQKKFMILETRNEGVRFTVTALRQLSEEYLELMKNYNEIQSNLVVEVLKIASGYADPVLVLNDIIAQLDAYTSLAHAASIAPIPYVRPGIAPIGQGDIILKGARHPCLEMQDNIAFIANDVTLLRDSECFQIITGPNMGGKSTYIRMIGVIVLMAQIGSFVPCLSASVSVVDCILARVGAGDSQLKGVSTFMSEMLETASILKTATKDSLIIIDELGRGTSTYDGFGLAWAISEYISTKICCFCLFATHFHELTSLSDEVPIVSNFHVTALTDKNTFTLLYKVKRGVCDQSFGIHVAELANFPLDVIEMAREKSKELEIFHKIEDNDSIDEPTAKRKRLEIKEGEQIIEECLKAVETLAYKEMEWADLQKELSQIKQNVLNKGNSYIEAVASST